MCVYIYTILYTNGFMIPCPGVMMIHLTYLHEFTDQRGSRDEFSPRCRKDQAASAFRCPTNMNQGTIRGMIMI